MIQVSIYCILIRAIHKQYLWDQYDMGYSARGGRSGELLEES